MAAEPIMAQELLKEPKKFKNFPNYLSSNVFVQFKVSCPTPTFFHEVRIDSLETILAVKPSNWEALLDSLEQTHLWIVCQLGSVKHRIGIKPTDTTENA